MKKVFPHKIVSAIDIGTTKICVLIGQKLSDEHVQILGVSKIPSEGLRRGVVVDIAKAAESIRKAIKEAELMAQVTISSAVIGISGANIQSRNAHGAVPLEKGEVRKNDIDAVLAAARAISIPEGHKVLHVLPQYYQVDNQEKMSDPLGMHGIRLETEVHIITGSVASVQNLIKCCHMVGIEVEDIVLEQLASAQAVLTYDERELGVGVLDIGGGTSDLAIYHSGSICHTKVFPIAGNFFTHDLAVGLTTTLKDAERIKKTYGIASPELLEEDRLITVEMVHGIETKEISHNHIATILEARAQELLFMIYQEINERNLGHLLTAGLVITGGGSLLTGIDELAQALFDFPVRLGRPHINNSDMAALENPMYATGYGLLLYAASLHHGLGIKEEKDNNFNRLFSRMKLWVSDFF
jgi:cell division protein FtsA